MALSCLALGLAGSCGWLGQLQERGLSGSALWRDSQTVTGSLGPGDPVNPQDGSFWDEIPITAQPGQMLIAALESQDFDAYLELVNSQGQVIGFDDDSGPEVDALLAVHLPEGGSYTLRATSFEPGSSGSYLLTYSLIQPAWQQTLSGRLQEGSAQHPEDGSWMDEHPLSGRAGQILIAFMTSSDFDAFLQLVDPNGDVVAWDDDQGSGTDALLIASLSRTGAYTLRANTYKPEQKGDYVLKYSLY